MVLFVHGTQELREPHILCEETLECENFVSVLVSFFGVPTPMVGVPRHPPKVLQGLLVSPPRETSISRESHQKGFDSGLLFEYKGDDLSLLTNMEGWVLVEENQFEGLGGPEFLQGNVSSWFRIHTSGSHPPP